MRGFVHAYRSCIINPEKVTVRYPHRGQAGVERDVDDGECTKWSNKPLPADPDLHQGAARADLVAIYERDPACHGCCKGHFLFQRLSARAAYRVGHYLWVSRGKRDSAYSYFLQMR